MSAKIYALLIFGSMDHALLYSKYHLTDIPFMFRSNITKEIEETSKHLISSTRKGNYYRITEKILNYEFVIYGSTINHNIIIITDSTYPQRTAYQLLTSIHEITIDKPKLDFLFVQYQDPKTVDKLTLVQTQLDETKVVLYESLNKLQLRESELKNLIDKTDQLVTDSAEFSRVARDYNRCCQIL